MQKFRPILYSFRRCPYAMRARMALAYAKIDFQHREILLKDKPQSMLDFSPKATVPVLIIEKQVIDESINVMMWALTHKDPKDWLLKKQSPLQKDMYRLIKCCDDKFKPLLDCYKYSDRHDLTELQYRDQCLWFLDQLDNNLKLNNYLLSEQVSLADIAIFPFIRQFAFVNKKWFDNNGYNHLQYWLEGLLNSTLFQSIMHKHQLWSDN